MIVRAYSEGPELIESGTDEANQYLEDKDIDDLAIGLEFKLRELCSSLALIAHDASIVARINNEAV